MSIKDYIERESQSVGATDPDALRRRLESIATATVDLEDLLFVTIETARDADMSWKEIAKCAGLSKMEEEDKKHGQAAQMLMARARARRGQGGEKLTEPDTTEGLSQKEAAAAFGVSVPTFTNHLKNPDTEIARRTTVIDGVFRGRRVPRYVISPE